MKNTLFILSLIIWCSCSSEIPFDADRAEDIVATRTANLDEYSFEIYGGALSSYYQYDCKGNLEKVMSARVSFHRGNNHIMISVRELYLNYPIFTATTTYSVKRDISCDIPHKIYNDGGEMNLTASITIRKGETKRTYETDYNGSPLV